VDGYITKPIDIEELVATIDKTIKKVKNIKASKNLTKQNLELTSEVEKNKQDLKTLNLILQRKNKELLRQLYTDDLTELANRKALNNDLSMLKNPFVITIDIDSFKKINSFYGTEVGNHILKNFALFLKKYQEFKIYRTGSDDFTLVLKEAPLFEQAKEMVENIIKDFKQKQFFHPQSKTEIYLDITIGASLPSGDRNVYKDADLALKKAQKDKVPYLFFSDGIKIDE
jgi:diguanylate cyclase (GGDEF)-like protein